MELVCILFMFKCSHHLSDAFYSYIRQWRFILKILKIYFNFTFHVISVVLSVTITRSQKAENLCSKHNTNFYCSILEGEKFTPLDLLLVKFCSNFTGARYSLVFSFLLKIHPILFRLHSYFSPFQLTFLSFSLLFDATSLSLC